MKKIKKFLLGNMKTVIAFILGLIIPGTTVYAAILFASSDVSFDNTQSGLQSTNVQAALDELNTKTNTWIDPMNMGTPKYYAHGRYKGWCNSTDTSCNSYADFPTTSTTPPSGENVYLAKYEDGQYGVCMQRNGKEHCFRARNYIAEAKHLQEVFSDISCDVAPGDVTCRASDFYCFVLAKGRVLCRDNSMIENCFVSEDGHVECL